MPGMKAIPPITTAEELLRAPDFGPCELVRGKIVMTTYSSAAAGAIAVSVGVALAEFVRPRKLGTVLGVCGFVIARDPDTVRVPRVAFIRAERMPTREKRNDYVEGPPDLAVEIISFPDRIAELNGRVQDWLDTGCPLVWVIDPDARTVTVYRSRTDITVLGELDTLSGGDVIPGLSLPVAQAFEQLK